MNTEKEINDAIDLLSAASKDGRVEVNDCSKWRKSSFHHVKYRAKPQKLECWANTYPDGIENYFEYRDTAIACAGHNAVRVAVKMVEAED